VGGRGGGGKTKQNGPRKKNEKGEPLSQGGNKR